MTQTEQIHEALKRGPITALGAFRDFNIMRLAPRIHELRRSGVDIETRNVRRHGKTYAEYRLS